MCVCVCFLSELEQEAAETFGSAAGFSDSFQPPAGWVSRMGFGASSRLCCGVTPPSSSAPRKRPSRVQLQRGARREPSSPVFFTTDGLLFMAESSSAPPPEERQPHAAVHGGPARRVRPVSGSFWRPASLTRSRSCPQQRPGGKQHPVRERPLPMARL